eukprot:GEMP01021471.1.p1 GENE.GEMP01021471.1~~GEMP01021471.1.p1  ORF type:complete len:640 (+),score=227.24 GEMP01021471.1:171-2090(+)
MRALFVLAARAVVGHPIGEVISMIQDLEKTAKADQERDDIAFQNTQHEYQLTKKDLERNVELETQKRDEAIDLSEAKRSEIDSLGAEIDDFTTKLGKNKDNEGALGTARDNENGVFLANEETLKATVAAMEECLAELAKGLGFTQRNTITHLASVYLPAADAKSVTAALQKQPEEPKARSYDSKTGGVQQLLVKLLRDFQEKLTAKQNEEQRALNAHQLSALALQGEAKAMSALMKEKSTQKGEAEAAYDEAVQAKTDAKTALADFNKTLRDTERAIQDATDEYHLVSKERNEEVNAMGHAVVVLEQVAGVRAEHKNDEGAPVFLQLDSPKDKAVALLRSVATELHNAQLQKLAMDIAAAKGPFDQISIMIQKMVDHLTAEQREEDNHKAWCDNELAVTNATKVDKTGKMEKIGADAKLASSKQEENKNDKGDAQAQISDLQKRSAAETEKRATNRKNNAISIGDARKAQGALQRALDILNQWKATRSSSVSTTEGSDKVFVLLQNAETHYAKMQADVEMSETQQETDFQTSKADAKKNVATLKAQIQGHEDRLHRLSAKLSALEKKRKHTSDAIFEVNQYLKDLKPACIDDAEAYGIRKNQRDKEKTALKEAKQILATAFDAQKTMIQIRKRGFLALQ